LVKIFIAWDLVGNGLATNRLADAARSDAMPEAAGGEGSHGAAKPHGIILVFASD